MKRIKVLLNYTNFGSFIGLYAIAFIGYHIMGYIIFSATTYDLESDCRDPTGFPQSSLSCDRQGALVPVTEILADDYIANCSYDNTFYTYSYWFYCQFKLND